MKRASYRNGIDFIAHNDEPMEKDPEKMIGYASVFLLSELFGVSQERVAKDVANARIKRDRLEAKS